MSSQQTISNQCIGCNVMGGLGCSSCNKMYLFVKQTRFILFQTIAIKSGSPYIPEILRWWDVMSCEPVAGSHIRLPSAYLSEGNRTWQWQSVVFDQGCGFVGLASFVVVSWVSGVVGCWLVCSFWVIVKMNKTSKEVLQKFRRCQPVAHLIPV